MGRGVLVAVALAALMATAPVSFAFQLQTVPADSGGAAKLADPDNLTGTSTDGRSGTSGGTTMRFGSTTLRFSGGSGFGGYGSSGSGMSPALQDRLMIGPYAVGGTAQPR